jgi:AcrR family transcriptional regulator
MAKKKLTTRKKPRQERSVATVEAILLAATYILTRRGWDAFTTNNVAEKAGVNIASLYQYFPNKETIVAELQRRHAQEMRRRWPAPSPAPSLEANMRLMLEAVVSEHRVNPALHRVFADELPRSLRQRAPPGEAEARWAETVAPLVRVPDPELARFIVSVAVHNIIHEAATDRPELLDHPLFIPELVRLLTSYLSGH